MSLGSSSWSPSAAGASGRRCAQPRARARALGGAAPGPKTLVGRRRFSEALAAQNRGVGVKRLTLAGRAVLAALAIGNVDLTFLPGFELTGDDRFLCVGCSLTRAGERGRAQHGAAQHEPEGLRKIPAAHHPLRIAELGAPFTRLRPMTFPCLLRTPRERTRRPAEGLEWFVSCWLVLHPLSKDP